MRQKTKRWGIAIFVGLGLPILCTAATMYLTGDVWRSSDRTKLWTPPAATDTLVGRASTDTLTAKSMSGSANTFTNLDLTTAVTGVLPFANGGTNSNSASNAINALVPSQTGNSGKVLTTNGSVVSWGTSGGAVTSVGLSLPGIFTVTGSPVTSSGTLTGTLATQSANTVWAGPVSGSAAAPTFRALAGPDLNAFNAPGESYNLGLTASVAANALTIALKQSDGATNASASAPVYFTVRSSTTSAGSYSIRSVTGALSITIPSGATLGQTSGMQQAVWVYLVDDGGTGANIRLCVTGVGVYFPGSSYGNDNAMPIAAVSGSSTSGTQGYCNSATNSPSPSLLVGEYLVIETTAGTWATVPGVAYLMPRPQKTVVSNTSFSPSFSGLTLGTNGSMRAFWYRSGQWMHLQESFTLGSSPTVPNPISAPMPSGFTIDSSNLIGVSNSGSPTNLGFSLVGTAFAYDSSVPAPFVGSAEATGLNGTVFQVLSPSAPGWGTTAPMTWAVGDQFQIVVDVPVTGWSDYGP